jgi:hypothetical protein
MSDCRLVTLSLSLSEWVGDAVMNFKTVESHQDTPEVGTEQLKQSWRAKFNKVLKR